MFRRFPFSAVVMSASMAIAVSAPAAEPITFESLLREMVDREAIARFPDPPYECVQASSTDRAAVSPDQPETWFANEDANHFIRVEQRDGRKEWVLMETERPGAVVRFWSANPPDGATLRFYLDGSDEPALVVPMTDLLGGTWRVGAPLSAIRSRGWNLYLPIPFARGCKITSDSDGFYYQINYRLYEPQTTVKSFSLAAFEDAKPVLRDVVTQLTSPGRRSPPPMLSRDLDAALEPDKSASLALPEGPAAIRSLTVRLHPRDSAVYRNAVLRLRFDGKETVWCPVSDFFGSGVGVNPYDSWWTTVDADGTMTCRWPMPYEQAAEAMLENLGDAPLQADVRVRLSDWTWDERSMHFYSTFRQEHAISTARKRDWNYVAVEGRGVYAGDSLAVVNPTTVWWGEGDEKIYVDGEAFPSHFGTGTEDYYGYAWGDWHFFEAPFHAQPRVDGPVVYGHTTLVRTRALDAIPFERALRFDMEVWHWRDVNIAQAATTWFYARPGAAHNRVADRTRDSLGIVQPEPPVSIAGAYEAEAMEIVHMPPETPWKLEANWWNTKWSGDAQIWFGCRNTGDEVRLRHPAMHVPEPSKVVLYATRYPDYGVIQVSVDGAPLGDPIDLYKQGAGVEPTGPIELGVIEPRAMPPVFTFEVADRNPQATEPGTYFGFDCIVLEPAESQNEPGG